MGRFRTTYWFVGHRIVEHEQQGTARAAYGERLLKHLARDLSERFGRGFSKRNLEQMRAFYLEWPTREATSSEISAPAVKIRKLPIAQTLSAQFSGPIPAACSDDGYTARSVTRERTQSPRASNFRELTDAVLAIGFVLKVFRGN
jgi:hypothetical protein